MTDKLPGDCKCREYGSVDILACAQALLLFLADLLANRSTKSSSSNAAVPKRVGQIRIVLEFRDRWLESDCARPL
jgi:hypothetical protein